MPHYDEHMMRFRFSMIRHCLIDAIVDDISLLRLLSRQLLFADDARYMLMLR